MSFDISKFAATMNRVSDLDTGLQLLSIALLDANKRNFYPPVQEFDALVESIEANGLLEPLTVVPGEGGRYRLISGHNRLKALRQLYDASNHDDRWAEIPCLVLPPMTEAQEQCAIIEGNRQRKKGGALLAEEARRLTKSYVARKEAGEEFKGRIRDRVAEALQVSATKLAVVNAIENNIKVPGFLEQWKTGDASESVLYEISKLPVEAQRVLWDRQCDGEFLMGKTVQHFGKAWDLCRHECPQTGAFCENGERMVAAKLKNGNFECVGCCMECKEKDWCGSKCKHIPEPESVKQIVKERATVGVDLGKDPDRSVDAVQDYLAARRQEDERFESLLYKYRDAFLPSLRVCEDRKDGIFILKERFKYSGSGSSTGGWAGSPKGLGVHNGDFHMIERTWTEVWDMLAVIALQEAGKAKSAFNRAGWQKLDEKWPKEGQLVLLSYENGIGGFQYQIARCVGGRYDTWPFIDPNNELSCEEFEDFDHWLALEERKK